MLAALDWPAVQLTLGSVLAKCLRMPAPLPQILTRALWLLCNVLVGFVCSLSEKNRILSFMKGTEAANKLFLKSWFDSFYSFPTVSIQAY